jgi:hypothetical protein
LSIVLRVKEEELRVIEEGSEEESQKGEEIERGNNQDWKEGLNGKVFGSV